MFFFSFELCEPIDEHQEQNARRKQNARHEPGVSFKRVICGCEGQDIGND
jgi:hypothetical protein